MHYPGTLWPIRLLLAFSLSVLAVSPGLAQKRLALSVGIDVYDNIERLKTAVSDAEAVGKAFDQLGFEATVEKNLPRLAFSRAWQKFLNKLEPGDTAALFFAGHGVEIEGLNYLLPRDVPKAMPGEDKVLIDASVRFNELMDNLRERRVRVALFIIAEYITKVPNGGSTRLSPRALPTERVPARGNGFSRQASARRPGSAPP